MPSPNILLLTATFDGIGPGRVMFTLARGLRDRGYHAVLGATHGPTSSALLDDIAAAGLEVEHLGMSWLFDPKGPRRVLEIVRRRDISIVHTRTIRADVVGRAATRAGAVVLNNVVNLYPIDSLTWHGPVKGRLILAITRATQRYVTSFVANAEALVAGIRETFGVDEERIEVVYDGIPFDRWETAEAADLSPFGITEGDRVCITPARLHAQKGLRYLIRAAPRVLERVPRARFLIVGEGPLRSELQDEIDAADLRNKVILTGWREDVPELVAASDAFVLPSIFEGLPTAVIEAMAARIAVVATAVGGTPEIVKDQTTGRLVPPEEPEALGDAIADVLLSDPSLLVSAATQLVHDRFSEEAMTEGFIEIYERALWQKTPQRRAS